MKATASLPCALPARYGLGKLYMMSHSILSRLYSYYIVALLFGITPALLISLRMADDLAREISIAFLCVGALAALLLTYLLSVRLTRPVQALDEALLGVCEGRFTRLNEAAAPKELAALVSDYNAMSAALEERQNTLDDQLRRTALLTRLSIELRESLDPQTIVRDILYVIATNTDAQYASIVLLGPDGRADVAMALTAGQVAPIAPEQARAQLGCGLSGWVLRHGRNVVIADASQDNRWAPIDDTTPVGSVIAMPLTHRRTPLGTLMITHASRNHFSSQDFLLLEGVAAQAGVAIRATQRYQEEQRRRDQALMLFSMSQYLTSKRSGSDLAVELLEKSRTIFEALGASLFLVDGVNEKLALFASQTDDPGGYKAYASQIATAAEAAWRRREPQTDILQEAGQMPDDGVDARGPAVELACVALPLLHNGVAIGAFALLRPAQGTGVFPASVWSLLTIFTNVVAAAFTNLQLIDQLQRRAEILEQQVSARTRQLQHSRDILRIVFDNLPDGLVMMNERQQVLAANYAFSRRVIGMQPHMIVGKTYPSILSEVEQSAYLTIEQHEAAPGRRRALCTDMVGQQRWYEIDCYPIAAEAPNGERFIERWRDITREEELHQRLLLHEQLTSLGHLAASVAHEVGNPLQSVRSCLDLCREEASLSVVATEYLDIATVELDRISGLIERLRDLYRLPSRNWESVDLNQLVGAVRQIIARQLHGRQIGLQIDLADDLPATDGQPDALRQVLLSMVLNAQEATPPGGMIRISTFADRDRRMSFLSVADNGSGISPRRISQIFEPSPDNQPQRLGLGLHVSKQVIERHQGQITLKSAIGAGTTVKIGLPWRRTDP